MATTEVMTGGMDDLERIRELELDGNDPRQANDLEMRAHRAGQDALSKMGIAESVVWVARGCEQISLEKMGKTNALITKVLDANDKLLALSRVMLHQKEKTALSPRACELIEQLKKEHGIELNIEGKGKLTKEEIDLLKRQVNDLSDRNRTVVHRHFSTLQTQNAEMTAMMNAAREVLNTYSRLIQTILRFCAPR
ncbi:MAG: hypothetical protein RL235_620 [Chlamydiota bacterium]|jgi:hypothetical protein